MLVLLNSLFQKFFVYRLHFSIYRLFKFYRHAYCTKFLSVGAKFTHCGMAKQKKNEVKSLKRKEKSLLIPANLHASINIDLECIKQATQNIRLKNKTLKSETEQMKFEIENKSIDVKDNSIYRDLVTII